MEFLVGLVGGGGSILKTFHGRGMDIFWNNTLQIQLYPYCEDLQRNIQEKYLGTELKGN